MITAAEFKKQISKTLAGHLRSLGFKGSGFNYTMSSDNFIFSIGVQASRWGGRCCAELGIHPKEIDSFGNHKIDLKNLKYYSCEFRQRLWRKDPADQWWQYSDDPELNIQVAEHIFHSIKEQALPIIQLFKTEPYILDSIEVLDLSNIYKNVASKLGGMILMTTDIRFAWALTKIFEKRNPEKAIQFAKFGLSKLDASSIFIGKVDFERIVRQDD